MSKKFKEYAVESNCTYEKYDTIADARITAKYHARCMAEDNVILLGVSASGWTTELEKY